jgi:hypothetical protein
VLQTVERVRKQHKPQSSGQTTLYIIPNLQTSETPDNSDAESPPSTARDQSGKPAWLSNTGRRDRLKAELNGLVDKNIYQVSSGPWSDKPDANHM